MSAVPHSTASSLDPLFRRQLLERRQRLRRWAPARDVALLLAELDADGVSEARAGEGDEFGAERVAAALEKSRGASAQAVVEAVLNDLADHRRGAPLTDDVTVMALRRVS